jgi:predicted RNA-binding protein with PUA-like domain
MCAFRFLTIFRLASASLATLSRILFGAALIISGRIFYWWMNTMRYWLMKSEPSDCSIDDLAVLPKQTVAWYGVRNYQARNFMRDQMKVGDGVLFYHSNCKEPGIAGIAKVSSVAYPDATQFNKKSKYFDAKATQETPRWFNVDVQLVKKIGLISIDELRKHQELGRMRTLQRGNRLSITPLDPFEWNFITKNLVNS